MGPAPIRHIAARPIPASPRDALRRTPRTLGRVAYSGLAVVLLFLAGFAFWAAITTHQAAEQATHASILSDEFQQARYWIGAEESLERKYRLEPGADVLALHRAAARSMVAALQAVRRDGEADDRELVDQILRKHTAYLDATWLGMFPAVDAHNTARIIYFEHTVVDPVFGYIERHVDAEAATHHTEALRRITALDQTQRWMLTTTPIVFTVGLALLLLFWVALRLYQRGIDEASQREAEQQAIRQSEERLRALVQNTSDIIAVVDAAGVISFLSSSIEAVLGYPQETVLGTSLFALLHHDDAGRLQQVYAAIRTATAAHVTTEVRMRHQDGSWRRLEVISTNLLTEPGIDGIVLNARDITERKAFEEQLHHQAFHDPLTTLPNRTLFMDRLEHALARATRQGTAVGTLFLDLDRFKLVNDSLGHEAGDQLLVAIADRLKGCVRQEDTVARFGGDEFALLLADLADASEAARTAERIIAALDVPLCLDGRDVVTATSIGIVTSMPRERAAARR